MDASKKRYPTDDRTVKAYAAVARIFLRQGIAFGYQHGQIMVDFTPLEKVKKLVEGKVKVPGIHIRIFPSVPTMTLGGIVVRVELV